LNTFEPALGTTSYTHTGLAAGTPYYYRMRAVAPATEVPPLVTTMNPAPDNTTESATTQTSEPAVPEPRVFFRRRIEQTD